MQRINVADIAQRAERIFLPNRYTEPFVQAYEDLTGERVPVPPARQQKAKSGRRAFMWTRGRDIPQVVRAIYRKNPGAAVIGLTGSEWCTEWLDPTQDPQMRWWRVGKRMGDVAILTPRPNLTEVARRIAGDTDPQPVVTCYPGLVERSGLNICTSMVISGGSEALPDEDALDMPVVDLVSSGASAEANGLARVGGISLATAYVALVAGISNE